MPFRLLDLPPEMRNRVYRSALVDRKPHEGVDAQLLVTCRKIHNEASALPYTEMVVNISVTVCIADGRDVVEDDDELVWEDTDVKVHTKDLGRFPVYWLPEGVNRWPEYLREIERLRLNVDLSGNLSILSDAGVTPYVDLNKALFSLTSFFERGHKLRHLDVVVDLGNSGLEEYDYFDDKARLTALQNHLYPLRKFGRIQHISLSGLSEVDRQLFLGWMQAGPDCHVDHHGAFENVSAERERREVAMQEVAVHVDSLGVPTRPHPLGSPKFHECRIRPRVAERWLRIETEFKAYTLLRQYLGLPQESKADQTTPTQAYHEMKDWTQHGFGEVYERNIVYWMQVLRNRLDQFVYASGGELVLSSRSDKPWRLAKFYQAREARKEIWKLDAYEWYERVKE